MTTLSELIGGGGGGAYDAVAAQMITSALNDASVNAGWRVADEAEVVDKTLKIVAQVDISSKTLSALASNASDMDAVAASQAARDIIGVSGPAYDAVAASSVALGKLTAGYAGLTPSSYADMAAIVDTDTAVGALLSTAGGRAFVINSSEVLGDVLASATARHEMWKSDDFLTDLLADSAAHDLVRAEGTLISKVANQSNDNDLTSGVTGGNLSASGKYLFLGVSGGVNGQSITIETVRAGSSRSGVISSHDTNGTNAETDIAVPIEGPTLQFSKNGPGNPDVYFLTLDCTPPV